VLQQFTPKAKSKLRRIDNGSTDVPKRQEVNIIQTAKYKNTLLS